MWVWSWSPSWTVWFARPANGHPAGTPHYFAPARGEATFRVWAPCSSWLAGSSCGQRIRGRKYSRTGFETGLVMRSLMFSLVGQYTGRTIPACTWDLTQNHFSSMCLEREWRAPVDFARAMAAVLSSMMAMGSGGGLSPV